MDFRNLDGDSGDIFREKKRFPSDAHISSQRTVSTHCAGWWQEKLRAKGVSLMRQHQSNLPCDESSSILSFNSPPLPSVYVASNIWKWDSGALSIGSSTATRTVFISPLQTQFPPLPSPASLQVALLVLSTFLHVVLAPLPGLCLFCFLAPPAHLDEPPQRMACCWHRQSL